MKAFSSGDISGRRAQRRRRLGHSQGDQGAEGVGALERHFPGGQTVKDTTETEEVRRASSGLHLACSGDI